LFLVVGLVVALVVPLASWRVVECVVALKFCCSMVAQVELLVLGYICLV
jgi:hypothetical protein